MIEISVLEGRGKGRTILSNNLDQDLTEGMSTKLNNIAKYKPFGLQKHNNEKFLILEY